MSESSGPLALLCPGGGKVSSESAVARAESVFGFGDALVLAVPQLCVRWHRVWPLLGQWPDLGVEMGSMMWENRVTAANPGLAL
jgi:hypothetical protein